MSSFRRPPFFTGPTTRRGFLRAGATGLALGAVQPYALSARRTPGNPDMLKVGLVGCGGRGTGAAAEALRADPNVVLVALADTFADQLAASLATLASTPDIAARVQVDEDHRFVGFDAYKGVVDTCDVVLLASTPHFRPLHVAAAVAAGRHMFVEKPVATDAPGVRSVLESCKQAREKRLSVVSGLCYRYQDAKRETVQRIRDGAVGEVVAMQTSYNTGGLWHRGRGEGWSDMEWQIRNWLYFTWLSGDHITEQHIHSLDKIAWVMGDEYPVRVTASGGRSVRTDPMYGNVYDHFNSVFEWKDGTRCFSSCRQWPGAASDVSDFIFGTLGHADVQGHEIRGANAWRWRSEEPDDMYQNEHDALFAAIRADEPIDDSGYMCKSTLMAIMARMAAYTGQAITWEQAWNSQEKLAPAAYEWGPLEVAAIAQPGITQFS